MMLGFWDIAPIIYMVGLVIAFVLIYERLAKPECYRIPFALFVAAMWPIALAIALALYIEGLFAMLKEYLFGEDC